MREFEADILSAADGNAMPDGKCVHLVYLKSEVDAELDTMNLAVGYFHEENDRFITRMAELEKSHQRYEKLRRLDPQRFHALWMSSLLGEKFDDLVDRLPS